MSIVTGPSPIGSATESVAVSSLSFIVTVAVCVRPPAVILTSPNDSSAACSVSDRPLVTVRALIVVRPRNVSLVRSGANQSV